MDTVAKKIFQLRLVVGRFGEMDRSKWWNTKGVLGSIGKLAISRGFPKTHVFARARAAFAVASFRSDEVFNPPDSYTLWRLPAEIEDALEDTWPKWLEVPDEWNEFLIRVDQEVGSGLLPALTNLELVSNDCVQRAGRLRRADDLRSVPVKLNGETVMEAIELLAAAHSCGEPGKLAVPFIGEEGFPK